MLRNSSSGLQQREGQHCRTAAAAERVAGKNSAVVVREEQYQKLPLGLQACKQQVSTKIKKWGLGVHRSLQAMRGVHGRRGRCKIIEEMGHNNQRSVFAPRGNIDSQVGVTTSYLSGDARSSIHRRGTAGSIARSKAQAQAQAMPKPARDIEVTVRHAVDIGDIRISAWTDWITRKVKLSIAAAPNNPGVL